MTNFSLKKRKRKSVTNEMNLKKTQKFQTLLRELKLRIRFTFIRWFNNEQMNMNISYIFENIAKISDEYREITNKYRSLFKKWQRAIFFAMKICLRLFSHIKYES